MAVENLYIDSWAVNSGLLTPDNALGSTTGTWTTNTDNSAWNAVGNLGTPSKPNASGSHTFTAIVRKDPGTNNPTFRMEILDSSGNVLGDSGAVSITSTVSQNVVVTIAESVLNTPDNLYGVQVRLTAPQTGGGPSARSVAQLDRILWTGDFVSLLLDDPGVATVWNGTTEIATTWSVWTPREINPQTLTGLATLTYAATTDEAHLADSAVDGLYISISSARLAPTGVAGLYQLVP